MQLPRCEEQMQKIRNNNNYRLHVANKQVLHQSTIRNPGILDPTKPKSRALPQACALAPYRLCSAF